MKYFKIENGQIILIQIDEENYPQQYEYCINKLGCGEVLDFIGIDYK